MELETLKYEYIDTTGSLKKYRVELSNDVVKHAAFFHEKWMTGYRSSIDAPDGKLYQDFSTMLSVIDGENNLKLIERKHEDPSVLFLSIGIEGHN